MKISRNLHVETSTTKVAIGCVDRFDKTGCQMGMLYYYSGMIEHTFKDKRLNCGVVYMGGHYMTHFGLIGGSNWTYKAKNGQNLNL